MELFAISFAVFALAAAAMALGAMFGRRPISSGCTSITRIEDGAIHCAYCTCCSAGGKDEGTGA
jgi:hypothetical protein